MKSKAKLTLQNGKTVTVIWDNYKELKQVISSYSNTDSKRVVNLEYLD